MEAVAVVAVKVEENKVEVAPCVTSMVWNRIKHSLWKAYND